MLHGSPRSKRPSRGPDVGRPAASVKLVPLHTLVTEQQKGELATRAKQEAVSIGVILRRILFAWEYRNRSRKDK
jgi:hypothetical protein